MNVTINAPEELVGQIVAASIRESYERAKQEVKELKEARKEQGGAFTSYKEEEDLKSTKRYVKALRKVYCYYTSEVLE
jgi:hypothetical protein